MRRIQLTFVFLLMGSFAVGQVVGRFHYNKYWELTKKGTTVYFRVCVMDTTNLRFAGEVRDFTRDGKLLMTGRYQNGKKNGEFVFRYPNGKVSMQGLFLDDQRVDTWKYFHPNGVLMQEVKFVGEQIFMIESYYDSAGQQLVKEGTGPWREEYYVYKYSKKIITTGELKEYQRHGDWTSSSEDGKVLLEEKYRNGKFLRGTAFDTTGQSLGLTYAPIANKLIIPYQLAIMESFNFTKGISQEDYPILWKVLPYKRRIIGDSTKTSNDTFTIIEESAFPSCGWPSFYKVLGGKIKYPPQARRMGIEGRVYVEFIIEKDGELRDFKVIKGIGSGCDEEAMRVVEAAAKECVWNPGLQRGNPVRQRYTMPVIFKLE